MAEFVHLHVHSQYSMLDGAIRVKDLVARTRELGMTAVAITDHGNMHGAVEFYKKTRDSGVRAILGCELGFTFPGERIENDPKSRVRAWHMPLLAASAEGYKNLIALVSHAWMESPTPSPFSTLEKLEAHAPGLVVLTGCLGGLVPQALLQHSPAKAREILGRLKEICDPGALFVELQDHGLVEQSIVNKLLVEMAGSMGLPVVATNDAHYLRRDDATAQRALSCIASGITLAEAEQNSHGSEEMYLKSPEEMCELFGDNPEATANTLRIREMCDVKLELGKPMLPNFKDASGRAVDNEDEYFARLSRQGLDERLAWFKRIGKKVDEAKYRERLETEVGVIVGMKFPGYFLIVQDFINWAKQNGVPVGPGRGSGAGSIVAYALKITDLDPIPYDLLFERFLNPERVSMPDFDVDFCMLKREKVIEYVRDKYGRDSVGQIATFQVLKAKSCVRDVGRVMGLSFQGTDAIAKLVPEPVQGKTASLKECLEKEPRLKAKYEEEDETRAVIDLAMKLEGLNRHVGMHAAGIVISEGPLWGMVPVFKGNGGELVTQFAKDEVEDAGLVKFDFLGLTTLTVIDIATELVRKRPDESARVNKGEAEFNVEEIPLAITEEGERGRRARETFELLQSGETTGVFQLESSGMQKLFKDLKPDCFEDIVAAVALYRPGPLGTGMVDDFVNRKNGKARLSFPHDDLKDILKDTYGVIVYQEQVMMIARKMGGYSLGGADLLRRAMGKKKAEEMAKQKSTFVTGALGLGYEESKAVEIFDLLEFFAGYGFNKCIVSSTVLHNAIDGTKTTVGELFQNRRPFMIHALGEDSRLHARPVTDVVWNGRKPVFELRTAQGKVIVATDNHPFRTLDGWTELRDLKVGDRIAAPRRLPVATEKRWPRHEVVMLGWLISEGNTCHPSSLYFFNNNPAAVDDFVAAARLFPDTVARIDQRTDGRFEVCLNTGRDDWLREHIRARGPDAAPDGVERLENGELPIRSGAFWWAHRLGLLNVKATEKRLPDEVFTLCDDDIELLLGRLWAGDGFLANATNFQPYYATSSERLAYDVQALLLRLGSLSGVHRKEFKYRGSFKVGFTVHLFGNGSIGTFLARIGPHCTGRKPQLELLAAHWAERPDGASSRDTIPAAVRGWIREERERLGLTWSELEARSGVSMGLFLSEGTEKNLGFRRSTIAKLAEFFQSERLTRLVESDVFWDRIVSIEARGEDDTYDLTVDVDHNFVANGLVVHNSHSAAYALITYQTAYLKRHFPVEFMCATLCSDLGKIEKLVGTIAEARSMGIQVMVPDVNESDRRFTVVYEPKAVAVSKRPANAWERDPYRPKIRVGLGGIKGVGDNAIETIVDARQGVPFTDIFDFGARVGARKVNKGVFESLVESGAFDQTLGKSGATRAQGFAAIETALERGKGAARERSSGQMGLFGMTEMLRVTQGYPDVTPWDLVEQLKRERDNLGLYLTGHPLDRWAVEAGRIATALAISIRERDNGDEVTLAGVVEGYRERVPKSGGRMAFFYLEDRSGRVEAIVRPKHYDELSKHIKDGEAILLTGKVRVEFKRDDEGNVDDEVSEAELDRKLMVEMVKPLAAALSVHARAVTLRLHSGVLLEGDVRARRLKALREAIHEHPGRCAINAVVKIPNGAEVTVSLPKVKVDPCEALIAKLERIFGEKVAEFRS